MISHRADARGFAWLASIEAPTAESRRAGLVRAAAALPTADLLAAARGTEIVVREAMLSRLVDPSAPGDATPDVLATGLLLLAEARLALERPDAALSALDAIPSAASESLLAGIVRARTVSLLWLGRVNDAEDVGGPVDAWLEGLERSLLEPHAILVAAVIENRFADRLTPEEITRLEDLRRRATTRDDLSRPPPSR